MISAVQPLISHAPVFQKIFYQFHCLTPVRPFEVALLQEGQLSEQSQRVITSRAFKQFLKTLNILPGKTCQPGYHK